MNKQFNALAVIILLLISSQALAVHNNIRWDGYMTASMSISDTSSIYRDFVTDKGSFDDTRIGLHFRSEHSDSNWNIEGQMFAAGYEEEFNLHIDWGFAAYKPTDEFELRLGKLKFPNSAVSEYFSVGVAYPWIRPPQEYYSQNNISATMTLESFNGGTAIFRQITDDMELSFQPFIGTSRHKEKHELQQMIGFNLGIETEYYNLRVGIFTANIAQDSTLPNTLDGLTKTDANIAFTMDYNNIIAYIEYGAHEIENNPMQDTTAGYITLGYRLGKSLPHLTYAMFEQESGWGQQSITIGIKQELDPSTYLKLELQNIRPDANSTNTKAGLFEGIPSEDNINVFGVAIDYVF